MQLALHVGLRRTGCIFWPHLDYRRISGNPVDPLWPFRAKNNEPRRRVSQELKQPFRSPTSVSSFVVELVAALTVRGAMPTYSAAGWTTTEIAPTVLHRQRCQTVVCEAELRHSAGSDILVPVPASSSLERASCGHRRISGPLQSHAGTRMSVYYGVRAQLLVC